MRRYNRLRLVLPITYIVSIPLLLLLANTSLNDCDVQGLIPICFGPITAILMLMAIPGFFTFGALTYLGINLFGFKENPLGHPEIYYLLTLFYVFVLGLLLDYLVLLIKSVFKRSRFVKKINAK